VSYSAHPSAIIDEGCLIGIIFFQEKTPGRFISFKELDVFASDLLNN